MLINLFKCSFRIRFNDEEYVHDQVFEFYYLVYQQISEVHILNRFSVRSDLAKGKNVLILEDTGKMTEREGPYTAEESAVIKRLWDFICILYRKDRVPSTMNELYFIESISRALGIGHLFYKSINLKEFVEEHFINSSSWWSQDTPIETDLPKFLLYDTKNIHPVKGLFSLITTGSVVLYNSDAYKVTRTLLLDAKLVLECEGNKFLEIADLITSEWLVPFLPIYQTRKGEWSYLYPEDVAIVSFSDLRFKNLYEIGFYVDKQKISEVVKDFEIYRSLSSIKSTGKPRKEGFLLSEDVYKALLDPSSRLYKLFEESLIDDDIEQSFNEVIAFLVLLKNPDYLKGVGVVFFDNLADLVEVSELHISDYIKSLKKC